ncbi:MAG: aminotransferase class V-fold PLP-dependent enzyme [Bacteroidaceae bacterium]|nr:aminotransferase class V-fold PLP-dependent enzyme [Bacteroidaceae bacterium]
MLHFDTDYMAGAHPEVLKRLVDTNHLQTVGYGSDEYTKHAAELIKTACGKPDARVYFLTGGTQTNATVIDGILAKHQGVLAAESGHISVHEAGAIEASGHKILTLPQHEGKVWASELKEYIDNFYSDDTYEHMVAPGMLYISYPTEYGTIYSYDELKEISDICHNADIPLYIDGARLAYGLAAENNSVTLKDIADLCDVFYIGGTKVGALFGEAVVITNPALLHHFFPLIKQHGALLAKGRLLGVQFEALFESNLYEEIGIQVVNKALRIRDLFLSKGFKTVVNSPTNQQFIYLPNDIIDRLAKHVSFELWGPRGKEYTTVRFVTGWTTTESEIDLLESILNTL